MKRIISALICIMVIASVMPAKAQGNSSKAFIVLEQTTGCIIEETNADEQLPIAGLAKLMSYLVIYEMLNNDAFDDAIIVSKYAASKTGTRVFLDAGAEYTVETLLKPAIMCSANDAITAIAEYLCGSEEEFVARMNGRAAELGISAVFADCTGISKDTHASARDLATIAAELAEYPAFFKYSSIWMDTFTHVSGRTTEMVNSNNLIKSDGFDGMSTGSSDAAGYCVAASYKKGGARYICVVLGDTKQGRFDAARKALTEASAAYSVKQVAEAGTRIKTVEIENGSPAAVNIVAKESLALLIKSQEQADISISIDEEITAPIYKGQKLGELTAKCGGETKGKIDLVAGETVELVTFGTTFKKITDIWINGC